MIVFDSVLYVGKTGVCVSKSNIQIVNNNDLIATKYDTPESVYAAKNKSKLDSSEVGLIN